MSEIVKDPVAMFTIGAMFGITVLAVLVAGIGKGGRKK